MQPVNVNDKAVTIQLFVESSTRHRAFIGIMSFTRAEFISFRDVLVRGTASKKTDTELIVHPLLHALEKS